MRTQNYDFMYRLTAILVIISFIFTFSVEAQEFDAFLFEKEKAIAADFKSVIAEQDDYLRGKANERILENMEAVLAKESSFDYEFKSLRIGKIRSKDDQVRIITWNIPFEDGTFKYFGFVQYFDDDDKYTVTRLTDGSDEIVEPERLLLTADKWYGALYYDMIQTKYKGKTYYTLLGWDGHSNTLTQKVIDVLTFRRNGTPVFGANVFKARNKTAKRIILRHASRAKVSVHYQAKNNRIVFDHLAPIKPQYAGLYEYYGPGKSYDAFTYKKGKWWLDTLVDVTNEKEIEPKRNIKYSRF